MRRVIPDDQQSQGAWFQFLWFLLHLTSAALHIGSALYHARRIHGAAQEMRPLLLEEDD